MLDRRSFLRLAAVGGGAVFVSGLEGCAPQCAQATRAGFFSSSSPIRTGDSKGRPIPRPPIR